jgi:hypothetical protein
MAKLPGWLNVTSQQVERDHLVIMAQVRYWHPGFWWYCAGVLWRAWREGR